MNMKDAMRSCGPFLHEDDGDRPAEVFGKRYTLHFAANSAPYVLLPIIPSA